MCLAPPGADDMSEQKSQSLYLLKALVIGMGALIVAGFAVVVVTIANRASRTPAARQAAGPEFGAVRLRMPAGSQVVETVAEGGRLVLRVALKDGSGRLVVIDLETGRRLGTIDLEESQE